MKIVSAEEMRAIDRATSERFGIPSLTLMENAGRAVVHLGLGARGREGSVRIGVVCGKGNNGGDGFVAARLLAEGGSKVRVLLLCEPGELRGDAAEMFARMGFSPVICRDRSALEVPEAAAVFGADVILDAILGTGFRPPVSDFYAAAIAKINASKAYVVAVDIPSGANADAEGLQEGAIARADAVVTFTAPRPAHVFGTLTQGTTWIAPIGSPTEAITSSLKLNLSTPGDFAKLLAPRARDANKGSYGHVLVVGGSLGKSGAAAMAGYSALRAGAGLSTVATTASILPSVAELSPVLMTEPLPETTEGTIAREALDRIVALAEGKKVVAVGPGISRNAQTAEFVRTLLKPERLPAETAVVLDADALNAFEGHAQELDGTARTIVLTPHPGEMARLTGLGIAEIQANRLDVARKFAREHSVIVVLKGHRTLTASPDGEVWVNPTGNPGMATGGTGDVLTGIVAGLIAQHPQRALEATALGVYLHGKAGDLASEEFGERSMIATDLLRYIPDSFMERPGPPGEFRFRA